MATPPRPPQKPAHIDDDEDDKPKVAPHKDEAPPKDDHPKAKATLDPEQALALLRGGHKLRKESDTEEKWFALRRVDDESYCICRPVTDEELKALVKDAVFVG